MGRDISGASAVFFDRDGVLIVDKGYQIDTDSIEFFPDTISAVLALDRRFKKIVITNQSGIGRGYFTARDVERFNARLSESLENFGIIIDGWYFCPHSPEENCDCRKPRPGLLRQAAVDFNLDLKNSWIVGDKSSDIEAGHAAGTSAILVKTGFAGLEAGHSVLTPEFVSANLSEAVDIINRSVN